MQKNLLAPLLFLIISSVLFSCGEDDSNPASDDLSGSWSLRSMTYEGIITSILNGEELGESPMSGEASKISIVFNFENNKLTSTGSMDVSVEFTDFTGVDFSYPLTGDELSGTYIRNGNSLEINSLTSKIKAEIVTLTDTELVLNFEREYKIGTASFENISNETGVMRFTKN